MPAKPRILIENFFSTPQFPGHTVTADQEAAGFGAALVGRGSRLSSNRWEPITANAEHWIRVQCDIARAADMIVVDGHNLGGKTAILETSNNGTTFTTVFSAVVPAAPGGALASANGGASDEIAWLKSFPSASAVYWRLRIPSMGPGLVPKISGIWLGLSWALAQYADRPFGDETYEVSFAEQELETAWIGAGPARRRKVLDLRLRLQSDAEYGNWRAFFRHWRRRRPAWVVFDPDDVTTAAPFVLRPGRHGLELGTDWFFRSGILSGVEHEPPLDE
jgi:hypothetical protein